MEHLRTLSARFTSNIGAQQGMRRSKYETMERLVRREAQRELGPELFARIAAVVVFNKLDYDALHSIAHSLVREEIQAQCERGYQMTGIGSDRRRAAARVR